MQNYNSKLKTFQVQVGEDVDQIMQKLQAVQAEIGVKSHDKKSLFLSKECTTIWGMFTLLESMLVDPTHFQDLLSMVSGFTTCEANVHAKLSSLDKEHKEFFEFVTILNFEVKNHLHLIHLQSSSI